MKKTDEYATIILTSNLSEEDKIEYLRYLYLLKKYSLEQLTELENRIYVLEGNEISEKDKLMYEANFLYAYYKKHDLDISDIRKLYYKIKRASNSETDINKVKMYITQLQLNNGLSIRFYKSYLDLLEKMGKENNRKSQRTYHK